MIALTNLDSCAVFERVLDKDWSVLSTPGTVGAGAELAAVLEGSDSQVGELALACLNQRVVRPPRQA